jgi:hypothetical protein
MLEELGQADEAVATFKAAVAHQRMTWSGADTPAGRRLGDLLLGMAGLTQRLDRHAASLAAAAEAIEVERRLAEAGGRPGGRDLGFALINYAIALVALARLSEGVAAGKEACDAFRAADQADDRYAGDLAMSLRMLAGWAKDAGDTRTALDASDQALQLRMPSTGERMDPKQADALVEEALRFSWLRTKLHQEPERALDIASMAAHLLQ